MEQFSERAEPDDPEAKSDVRRGGAVAVFAGLCMLGMAALIALAAFGVTLWPGLLPAGVRYEPAGPPRPLVSPAGGIVAFVTLFGATTTAMGVAMIVTGRRSRRAITAIGVLAMVFLVGGSLLVILGGETVQTIHL